MLKKHLLLANSILHSKLVILLQWHTVSLKVARNVYSCTVVLLSKSLDMVTKNVSPFVKMSGTVGVERIFPIESPAIDSITVNKVGKVRSR